MTGLPKYWESMDVSTLWEALNHPDRFLDAPNATYAALLWSLLHSKAGLSAANKRRLIELSPQQLNALIGILKERGCAASLLADIERLA